MKNITNKKLISYFPKLVNTSRDEALNDDEVKMVIDSFYKYAEGYGYFKNINKCLELKEKGVSHKFMFIPQKELAETLIKAIFQKKQHRIYLSLPRQIGKTEIVTMVASFCYDTYFPIFKKPFSLAVVTPNSQTSSAIFSRLCQKLYNMKVRLDIDKNIVKQTVRGDRVELFSIFSDKRSATTEGRTFHLIIRDEAHEGDDMKFEDELLPALNSTNGSFVMIGNGCFKNCMFWEGISMGDKEMLLSSIELQDGKRFDKYAYNKVIRYPYTTKIKPYFEKLGHAGLTHFLNIVASIELEKTRTPEGAERPAFRKNYECELVDEQLGYLSKTDIYGCVGTCKFDKKKDVYLGLDIAIKNDRTIAIVMSESGEVLDIMIVKDSYHEISVSEQMDSFLFTLSRKEYVDNIRAIGLDFNGGYGDAARTILEKNLSIFIYNYKFYRQKKHIMYANLKQSTTSIKKDERITIDPSLPNTELLVKELCDLQVRYDKNGFGEYFAPRKHAHFDDTVSALAIVNDIRQNYNLLLQEESGGGKSYIESIGKKHEYFISV